MRQLLFGIGYNLLRYVDLYRIFLFLKPLIKTLQGWFIFGQGLAIGDERHPRNLPTSRFEWFVGDRDELLCLQIPQ